MDERRRQARILIDQIRVDGGGATPEDIQFLRENRPSFLKSFFSLQKQLGGSAKILSEQLNSKDTHFVYELIQNAEDNKYANDVQPFLAFKLEDNRLIVDSNETGFTQRNIEAISKINDSTKSRKSGFIGEKGIGFKSVFRVAWKVHIHSEPYSFAFIHHEGDNGMGMVTPLNEEYLDDVPEDIQTRMILYFRDNTVADSVEKELRDLPNTLLLFLDKLKRLSVNVDREENDNWNIMYSWKMTEGFNSKKRVTIMKLEDGVTSEYDFWVVKRKEHDMPNHPARDEIDHAEVVLAFPLNGADDPIIETQWISAYLPLRQEDFKFLIQSDFITGANREDVMDCAWNDRLLRAIAQAFVSAAEDENGFLQHSTLRFSWVRYIPTNPIAHYFWGKLQRTIIEKLRERRLFFSSSGDNRSSGNNNNGNDQWTVQSLRIVSKRYRDGENNPLLLDLKHGSTAYISEKYDHRLDLPVLKKLGTVELSASPDFLDRLTQDLSLGNDSRWRSIVYTDDWFTRISNLLLGLIGESTFKDALEKLDVVQLETGKWVAPRHGSIFFPTSGDVDIPNGLKLSLLDGKALDNPAFKDLLKSLGVGECKPHEVIPLIEQRYGPSARVSKKALLQDIVFLFWHHTEVPETGYNIFLSCHNGTGYCWYNIADAEDGGWLYAPKLDHPYALYKLLDGKVPTELKGQVKFVRQDYFDALEECGLRHGKSGSEWLQQRAQIKLVPQLRDRTRAASFNRQTIKLSSELKYIAENMPHYLLGVLQHAWFDYVESDEWDRYMKEAEVPILESPNERPLETTFLPLPSLLGTVKELGLSERFGFLEELDGMTEVESVKWDFLKRFGVGVKDDLHFWLTLLQRAKEAERIQKTTIFKIYARLQTFIDEEDVKKIWRAFDEEDLIYAPSRETSDRWEWVSCDHAVWNGPEWFTMYQPLNNLTEYRALFGLFVNTLAMLDVTVEDCLVYLDHIGTEENVEEYNKIVLLYSKLEELAHDIEDTAATKETIRSRFEDDCLIWDPVSELWLGPSACVWAEDHIKLPGMASLASTYKEQLSFFRDILSIKKPSVEMHIASLIDKASENPDKSDILQEMRNISVLGCNSDTLRSKLLGCSCFPVRKPSGDIEWLSHASEFAIVDRTAYEILFRDKIQMLDFTLTEVHSVKEMLYGLGLEERMLSRSITEETQAEESSPDLALTESLKSKAYAITRYIAHLGALDPLRIFAQLQELEVMTSDKLSRTVTIKQGRRIVTLPTATAFFHLEVTDGHLKLCIPKDVERQQVCLFRQLPIGLLEHFGARAENRGVELGAIITARSLFVVDTILDQDGVIEIEGVYRPETVWTEPTLPTPSIEIDVAISATRAAVRQPSLHRTEHYFNESSWPGNRSENDFDEEPIDRIDRPDLFKQLISFVVEQANLIEGLPMKGLHVLASRSSESVFDHGLAVDIDIHGRALRRIGAVGELFVFTLLNKLTLPNFSRSCWKSNIRHLVSVHEGYSDLGPWGGTETSDIVYFDSESTLTDLLIRQGYLTTNPWSRRTPTYYIEVKATMEDVDQPFYCSQPQFDRMEAMELPDDGSANDVYLIARVFGVGRSRMGLKLYLDPWKMRRNRELRFEAKMYSVTAC